MDRWVVDGARCLGELVYICVGEWLVGWMDELMDEFIDE